VSSNWPESFTNSLTGDPTQAFVFYSYAKQGNGYSCEENETDAQLANGEWRLPRENFLSLVYQIEGRIE